MRHPQYILMHVPTKMSSHYSVFQWLVKMTVVLSCVSNLFILFLFFIASTMIICCMAGKHFNSKYYCVHNSMAFCSICCVGSMQFLLYNRGYMWLHHGKDCISAYRISFLLLMYWVQPIFEKSAYQPPIQYVLVYRYTPIHNGSH